MEASKVNVLLTSFPGLGLPSTLCLPFSRSTRISDFISSLQDQLPPNIDTSRLILTTTSNKAVAPSSQETLSNLLGESDAEILPLRLSVPLCGGKGGFGSQLRAAGGKMSSRRKKNQGDENGSSRNLDGRRLRTVNEAKALAEYLAVKPGMEAKEKDERKKRWAQIVEDCERRIEEEKSGKGKARVDDQWAEDKEEAEKKARAAIERAFAEGHIKGTFDSEDSADGSEGSGSESAEGEDGDVEEMQEVERIGSSSSKGKEKKPVVRKVHGWDEDDEDSEDD